MKKFLMILVTAGALLCGSSVAMAQYYSQEDYSTAYELLETMKMEKLLEETTASTVDTLIRSNPQLRPYKTKMLAFYRKYLSYANLKEQFAEAYLQVFSPKEIKELIRFYRTPLGRKLTANQAKLTQVGMEIGEREVQAHIGELEAIFQ